MPGFKRSREWMPFFIDDYRADTLHLSHVEHSIYIHMLFYLWQHPEGLPLDNDMARRFHAEQFLWDQAWIKLQPFFYEQDGMLRHKRIDFELGLAAKLKENRSAAAAKRWENESSKTMLSTQTQTQTDPDPPIVPQGDRGTLVPREAWRGEFETFWSVYPRKIGKGHAEKAWSKLKPPLDSILQALSWQIRLPQWMTENGKYTPHPATYLRAKRWLDSPPRNGPNLSGNSAGMLSAIERLTRKEDDE